MFTVSKETMERKLKEYTKKVPKPLNRQFPERLSKAAAIEKKKQRDEIVSKLIPPGTFNHDLFAGIPVNSEANQKEQN